MKVAIVLLEDVNASHGGNYSYYSKLVDSIDKYQFTRPIEICYVGRMREKPASLNRPFIKLTSRSLRNFFLFFRKIKLLKLLTFLFKRNFDWSVANDHRLLRSAGVNLVFYLRQFYMDIDDFPFLTINWDIGHKSTFIFPEFSRSVDIRNDWYGARINNAFGMIVESEASRQEAIKYLAFAEEKIAVVPLFAGGVVDQELSDAEQLELLTNHSISPGHYFFYPAKFWAHKNHFNLIVAFDELIKQTGDRSLRLVFTGSDGGNKSHIIETIRRLGLEEYIVDLGFVDDKLLYTLYRNATALIMPSFLGPTNMPILEAQVLKTPVICSDLQGHREICLDSAIYFEPSDVDQMTQSMKRMMEPATRLEFKSRAEMVYETSIFKIHHALERLDQALVNFSKVRRTFP